MIVATATGLMRINSGNLEVVPSVATGRVSLLFKNVNQWM